jgi:hypothetical protein
MNKDLIEVCKLRDEYFANDNQLSPESLKMLEYHLGGQDYIQLVEAFDLVAEARLMQFTPLIATYLDHFNPYVRLRALDTLLDDLVLVKYAAKGLEMYNIDPSQDMKDAYLLCLCDVFYYLEDKKLQQQIGHKILTSLFDDRLELKYRSCLYQSIVIGLGGITEELLHELKLISEDYPIDEAKIEEFKRRYL